MQDIPTIDITKPLEIKEETKSFSHQQLLETLYFVWEAFHRAGINFFLTRQTGRAVLENANLHGDHLDIGVRLNEWISGQKPMFDIYLENEGITPAKYQPREGIFEYVYHDVPFVIRVYEDNECLLAPVEITYEYETWFVPNQFDRFCEEFDK